MSELDGVLESVGEHGPGVAIAAGALIGAQKVLGPSLDMAGRRLAELAEKRLDNLSRTFAKVPVEEQPAHWYPHPRTVARVLNDASLYDDDVMQTYVAGLLSGSRNDDGSDDRPVYYLSVIDGLTALQLKTFHALYAAATSVGAAVTPLHWVQVGQEELIANVTLLNGGSVPNGSLLAVVVALEAHGLIANASTHQIEDGSRPLTFVPTHLGALLYDWAHGISDEDITLFAERDRPYNGLPALSFEAVTSQPT